MVGTQQHAALSSGNKNDRWLGPVRWIGWSIVLIVLVAPTVANLFTAEVDWTLSDHLFAGVLLIGTGLLFELVVRRRQDNAFRAGAAIGILTSFALLWVNAAVGLVGSGPNAANVLYVALIGIAIASSFVAGFKAAGMVKAMLATAIAQALITAVVFLAGGVRAEESVAVLVVNVLSVGSWCASALLFRRAAGRDQGGASHT